MTRLPDPCPVVTVIGEALIDLVAEGAHHCYRARPGGSPYNVAIGLARLGVRTSLMARLADNGFGRLLRAHAQQEGLDLSAAPHAVEPTTLAVVSLDEQSHVSYDFYLQGTADWQWIPAEVARLRQDTAVLHFGSIASWTQPGSEQVLAMVREVHAAGRALISYDPNVRPSLLGDPAHGRELVEGNVGISHLVKASREDVEWLYPGIGIEHVAARWLELGALLVVVTDGAHGAQAFRPGRPAVRREGRSTRLVDSVGAGDSFTAGLVAGLIERGLHTADRLARLDDPSLQGLLNEAILVSSLTCERPGADPPTAADRDLARVGR